MDTYQKIREKETPEERYQRRKLKEEQEQKENFQNLLDKVDEDDRNEPSKVGCIIDKIKDPEQIVYSLPDFDKTIYIQKVRKKHWKKETYYYETYYKFGETMMSKNHLFLYHNLPANVEGFIEFLKNKYIINKEDLKIKKLKKGQILQFP